MIRRSHLALAVGLILLVCLTRLIGIATFPPFIDETIHIHTGEIILQNRTPFYNVELGRQLTVGWLLLFQPAASAPIWVARVATLLATLPGFAALLAIARRAAGRWTMLLFGLYYLFSTYAFFFERLALADPIAGSAAALAICFAHRLSRRIDLRDALLTGALLFAAFAAKSSAAPDYGVPLAAALALCPRGSTWRSSLASRMRWLVVALAAEFGLAAIFVLVTRLRGYDILTNSFSLAVSGHGAIDQAVIFSPARIAHNIVLTFNNLVGYVGVFPLILLLIGVLLLMARRRWYLPLCLLGPVVVIWLNTAQETRYFVTAMTLLLLCGAVTLAGLTGRSARRRWVTLAITAAWGVITWLPFALTAARDPAALPLPPSDYGQYVLSDASGFGFAEVYAVLRQRQPQQVIGALANCQGLRFVLPRDFPLTCPVIHPNGQDRDALARLFDTNRGIGTYIVLEDIPYVPASAPGTRIAVIDVGRPRLSIYDLAP